MCTPQGGTRMLSELRIDEYFTFFLERTMLSGFVSRPYKTYAEISREFLTIFRFAHTKEKLGKKGKASLAHLMLNLL
jgi:hypothetical protein